MVASGSEEDTGAPEAQTSTSGPADSRERDRISDTRAEAEDWYRGVAQQRPYPDKQKTGTHADWAMVRLTRWIIGLTLVTALCAIGAVVFSGLQWEEAHEGGKTAEKQAMAAQSSARAAVIQAEAARRSADAAAGQVAAANLLSEVTRKSVAIAASSEALQKTQLQRQAAEAMQSGRTFQVSVDEVAPGMNNNETSFANFTLTNVGSRPIVQIKTVLVLSILPATNRWNPDIMKQELRKAPIAPASVGAGRVLRNITRAGAPSGADFAALLTSGAMVVRAWIATEYKDSAGSVHHAFACGISVRNGQGAGRDTGICPAPVDD